MSMLEKLIAKKKLDGGAEPMDPIYKDSKMSMLKELRNNMSGMMKDELTPIKKVSVMADDEDGLATGLDKAKSLVSPVDDSDVMEEGGLEVDPTSVEALMQKYLDEPSAEVLEMLMAALEAKKSEMKPEETPEGESEYA